MHMVPRGSCLRQILIQWGRVGPRVCISNTPGDRCCWSWAARWETEGKGTVSRVILRCCPGPWRMNRMEVVLFVLGQPCNFREAEVCLVWTQNVKTRARWGGQAPPCLIHQDSPETLRCLAAKQREVGGYSGTLRCGGGLSQPGRVLTAGGWSSSCVQPRPVRVIAFGQPVGPRAIQGQSLCFQKFLSKEEISQTDLLSFCKQPITQENVITRLLCY